MLPDASNLIWIDLEMTGLDPTINTIIEIATLVTDVDLNVVEEGPVLAIHQNNEKLAIMDEWNTRQHGKSGLTKRVQRSDIDLKTAEKLTIKFLKKHIAAHISPMCGNTICQDRRFLYHYMPTLEQYFHYRNIDVSTLKELAQRWRPKFAKFEKHPAHLAINDIYDSIDELKYYRSHFLQLD
ncbi:MAG: oligoribonuclease [Thiomargarita sp.]|nr:oligoribonuclease [Thiomargarita sp.]